MWQDGDETTAWKPGNNDNPYIQNYHNIYILTFSKNYSPAKVVIVKDCLNLV